MSIYPNPEPPRKSVVPVVAVIVAIVVVLCGAMVMVVMLKVGPTTTKVPSPVAVIDTTSPSPSPRPSPSFSPSPSPIPTKAATAAAPAPTRVAAPAAAPPQTHSINLYPVTALGSQATIDQGKLVTWMTGPCLLAGHDNMGWAFLAKVATGTIVNVHGGPCAGTYQVTAHQWIGTHDSPVLPWMSNYALILQSCTGSSGMGFSMAQRV